MNKEIDFMDIARAIKEAKNDVPTKEKVHRKCIQANSLGELLDKMEGSRERKQEIASRFVGKRKQTQ